MGWSVISRNVRREDVPTFLKSEFESDSHTIVDCVVRNNEAYLAIRENLSGRVYGEVVLLKLKREETGYKPISEDMGPMYFNCPKRIIKKLSPTEDKRSLAWRAACVNKHKRLDSSVYEAVERVLE